MSNNTHCQRGHEFTPENTIPGRSHHGRECRTCANVRKNAAQRARRARSGGNGRPTLDPATITAAIAVIRRYHADDLLPILGLEDAA